MHIRSWPSGRLSISLCLSLVIAQDRGISPGFVREALIVLDIKSKRKKQMTPSNTHALILLNRYSDDV
jgi:hypothetical protein